MNPTFVTVSHSTAPGSPDGRTSTENRTVECPNGPRRKPKKNDGADPPVKNLFQ